jgi:hypothetical protein
VPNCTPFAHTGPFTGPTSADGTLNAALISRTLALPVGGMSSLSSSTDRPRSDDLPVPATV